MLADPITLDTVAGTDVVFKLRKSSNEGTERIDAASTAQAPKLMHIKHSSSGKNTDATDRHLVSFSHTVLNAAGVPKTAVVNLTISVPRDAAVTDTVVKDLVCHVSDFINDGNVSSLATTANLDAVLRGES